METEQKKQGAEEYYIIKNQQAFQSDYQMKMVVNNNIEGLIPLKIKRINNKEELQYHVTGMISLKKYGIEKPLSNRIVYQLIKDIVFVNEKLQEYLLDESKLLIKEDTIFFNRKMCRFLFCYSPISNSSFKDSLKNLFENILIYIDHNDKTAVKMGYGIEQMLNKEGFSIKDMKAFAEEVLATTETEDVEEVEEEIEELLEDEIKTTLWQRIRKIFLKKENTEELLFDDYENNNNEEDCEEATVLLSSNNAFQGIALETNIGEEIFRISPQKYPCVVGKGKTCDEIIRNPAVSRVHIRLSTDKDSIYIEDLNSTNGTFINDEKIESYEMREIKIGDKITLANMDFKVIVDF